MKIIKPREELRHYVRYYWFLESDEVFSVLTFPIGCPQMIFHRKTPLYVPELGVYQNKFTISGQVNFSAHIHSDGNLEMIVVVFYPHTIGMFIDASPSDFYNFEISGYDIGNRQLNDLADRIFDCNNLTGCIGLLESWLLSRINPPLILKNIHSSIAQLLRDPSITISSLAEIACLGKRQYERVFRHTVGMNPKEYARIARFQKALWHIQQGEEDYAGIAAESGYSDQSHLIREFRTFSRHTPRTLRQYCIPYSDLFTNPV